MPSIAEEKKAAARERARAWRAANRERHRESVRRWREENPEAYRDRMRRWYDENTEQHLENGRRWRDENRTRYREIARRDAARRRGACPDTEDYAEIVRLDPCSYCGCPADQADHVVPLAADGENHWENLTGACGRCNRSKSDRPLLAWMATR